MEAELAQELASTMKQHEKEVNDKETEHSKQLETIKEEHAEKIQHLENNLQQLVVEHDTKSHQIMFDYSRQIDELNQVSFHVSFVFIYVYPFIKKKIKMIKMVEISIWFDLNWFNSRL